MNLSLSELLAPVTVPNASSISRQPGKEARHYVPQPLPKYFNNYLNYIHFSYGKIRIPSTVPLAFCD